MKDIKSLIKNEIKKIPLSYYAGFAIDMKADDNAQTSYCDVENRQIVIATNQLSLVDNVTLDNIMNDEVKLNSVVRGVVYHELSHAILTPKELLPYAFKEAPKMQIFNNIKTLIPSFGLSDVKNLINIVEDERIETTFKNMFMNVNFKKNIKLIANYDACMTNKNINAFSEFFNMVRFRTFSNELNKAANIYLAGSVLLEDASRNVKKCLKYALAAEMSSYKNCSEYCLNSYVFDILIAFYYVAELIDCINTLKEQQQNQQSQEGENEQEQNNNKESQADNTKQEQEEQEKQEQEQEEQEKQEQEQEQEEQLENKGASCKEIMEGFKKALVTMFQLKDSSLISKQLEPILKKHNKEGLTESGSYGYSGRIDPHKIARNACQAEDNYKWFARSFGDTKNNKKPLLINMFLDSSGSYADNVPMTQQIIEAVLNTSKTGLFKANIFSVEYGVNQIYNAKEFVDGGNTLICASDLITIKKAINNPNYDVLNILMFDGCIGEGHRFWHLFNSNNNYIIYEKGNKVVVEYYCDKANKSFVKEGDFTDKIVDNFLKAVNDYLS